MVSLIVAVAENGVIGKDNDLIWYLPKDLNYFKHTTAGHVVIMGRKNYDSIPEKFRPLPKRTNVVVTTKKDFTAPGCEVFHSIEDALKFAHEQGDQEPFIIGGGQIYKYALDHDLVDRQYVTYVHDTFDGDTFFPDVDLNVWEEVSREDHPADSRHQHAYSFVVYEKRQ